MTATGCRHAHGSGARGPAWSRPLRIAGFVLACLTAPLHAQSLRATGEIALVSRLVDQGLALTPETPVLQGSVSWASPGGWSLGVAAAVEVRSPADPVLSVARVSHSWMPSGDWLVQAGILHYDYRSNRGRAMPDRSVANLYVSYRDTVTFGVLASRVSGDKANRVLGAADVGISWPLTARASLSAGAGVAQSLASRYDGGYRGHRYGPGPVRVYGYGSLGLAWREGPWRLQLDRTTNSLGDRSVYGARASQGWIATCSRAF